MTQTLLDRFRGRAAPAEPAELPDAPEQEEAGAERRRSVRHATVFQIARLTAGDRQELCILRNVSPGGLKAEVYIEVAQGERVAIELKTGHRLSGRVVWTREQFIGVQFDAPVPMMSMLAHCSVDERVGRIRPPRIDIDLAGTLKVEHEHHPVHITNVSQAGLKLSIEANLRTESRCEVRLDELGWKRGTVRWCHAGEAGIMLVQPMLYPEFAAWRRALHERG